MLVCCVEAKSVGSYLVRVSVLDTMPRECWAQSAHDKITILSHHTVNIFEEDVGVRFLRDKSAGFVEETANNDTPTAQCKNLKIIYQASTSLRNRHHLCF